MRGAELLGVPVVCGPPASRPRRELRSARRLEARPGPATAHGHRSQAPPRSPPVPSGPSTPVGPVVLSTIRLVSRPALALPPPTGAAAKLAGSPGTLCAGGGGGFALHEAFRGRVVGVSDPRVVQFPPRLEAVRPWLEAM